MKKEFVPKDFTIPLEYKTEKYRLEGFDFKSWRDRL